MPSKIRPVLRADFAPPASQPALKAWAELLWWIVLLMTSGPPSCPCGMPVDRVVTGFRLRAFAVVIWFSGLKRSPP